MAFNLPGGFIFDRPVDAVGRNSKGELLYDLTNISELSIEFSADTKDATDANGALVKRFYTAKTGTVSMTNAFMSLAAYTTSTGTDAKVGTADAPIQAPKIQRVTKGKTSVEASNVVDGTLRIEGLSNSGNKIEGYKLGSVASATEFVYDKTAKTITLPTEVAEEVVEFLITYDRLENDAVEISNFSDQFPKQHQLTIRVIGTAPCEPDIQRAIYIVIDNFQPSPETSLGFQTESNHEFSGDILTSYCGTEKKMVSIYYVDEEED